MRKTTSKTGDIVGSTVSRYQILTSIGAGGMGEVFRARDPQLGREVALKILPDHLRDEPGLLSRFEQEVRAVGSIDHPSILTVHDIGTYNDRPYLVSELLEGSSLKDRMASGDLTARRSLQLAAEIAEGLAAAHGRGVIHRDIKPANIFITTEGRAKILDFGIAKLAEEVRGEDVVTSDITEITDTRTGAAIGTPPYMSPEQMRGDPVDHRTDIFSFGVVLYEMLAGRRPFQGSNPLQLAAAIQSADPPSLADTNHRLPPGVEGVIRRCLEKRPEERFSSAHDVALIIRSLLDTPSDTDVVPIARKPLPWRSIAFAAAAVVAVVVVALTVIRPFLVDPPLPESLHLAVLPFTSTSGDAEPTEFAAGIGEDLRDQLAFLEEQEHGQFWVLSRQNLRETWGIDTSDPKNLTALHNVTLFLRGEFHPSTDHGRLKLELVDASTGNRLRHLTVDHDIRNLSDRMGPLDHVAELLNLEVGPQLRSRLESRSTDITAAASAYLRGRGAYSLNPRRTDTAIQYFQSALKADSRYAIAYAWLALAGPHSGAPADQGDDFGDSLEAAQRAVSLAPDEPLGYVALSTVQRAAGLNDATITTLAAAPARANSSADFALKLAQAYKNAGEPEQAIRAFEMAANRRPTYWESYWHMGFLAASMESYDTAANRFRQAVSKAPRNIWSSNGLAVALLGLDRRAEAVAVWQRQADHTPNFFALSNLGVLAFDDQNFGDAAAFFERAIVYDDSNYQVWSNLGAAYFWSNNTDRARDVLRRAITLTDVEITDRPEDPQLLAVQASNLALFGDQRRGTELVERAASLDPSNSEVIASIAEAYEDLGQRDAAIEWLHRALSAGYSLEDVKRKPAFRNLQADARFSALVIQAEPQS